MTCIVGLVEKGAIYMGGDSAACSDWDVTIRRYPKVFRCGEFLFGVCGCSRLGDLLQFALDVPRRVGDDVRGYMTTVFIDHVRDCFKAGGLAKRENEVEEGGTFVVAYAGSLFTVYSDYQVASWATDYVAIGHGRNYALGSLYATPNLDPMDRVGQALECAGSFDASVRAPYHVVCSPAMVSADA